MTAIVSTPQQSVTVELSMAHIRDLCKSQGIEIGHMTDEQLQEHVYQLLEMQQGKQNVDNVLVALLLEAQSESRKKWVETNKCSDVRTKPPDRFCATHF